MHHLSFAHVYMNAYNVEKATNLGSTEREEFNLLFPTFSCSKHHLV